MYSIFFTSQANRVFEKLPSDVQDKLKKEAAALSGNPLAGEPLQGRFKQYRSLHESYKGVAYLIIYHVISVKNMIVVVLADKRENIYKHLEEMKL